MENGVKRWLVDVAQWNPSENEFASLLTLFPAAEQNAITRFVKLKDRKRALISRLLQYSLVHEVLGIPHDKIIMHRTMEGKPYLRNTGILPFPSFNFSASHDGRYVGIASEPVCLVGLDIVFVAVLQQETTLKFINNFSSYFTALEWKNIITAGTAEEMLAEFYRYWSLKEAYVKAIGAGVGYGLHRLEFRHTCWTNISVWIDGIESRKWKFHILKLDDTHWASVARGLPNRPVDNHQKTLEQIDSEDEEYLNSLLLPEPGFALCSVDDLIPHENCGSKT